jgi:uncharacterized protein YdeI (YjbR/CyaY-like superfamily)
MNPAVDSFFSKAQKWQDEMALLRVIVLSCGLVEELKWGVPCYTYQQKNIVMIHGFKEYCALLFHKGSLIQDSDDLLIQQTENVQSGRQIRFTNSKEIIRLEPILKAYIFEAIEVEKAGIKIAYKKPEEYKMPDEFKFKLDEMSALKTAFEALTPGRQRSYLLHFAGAKQSKTRLERIEKYIPTILKGKGITDCTCGLSKKMPSCDGSHKSLKLIG